MRNRGAAFQYSIGGQLSVKTYGTNGVIVTRNNVIDIFRGTIGVDHRNHRNTQFARFFHRDVFMADINDEHDVRQAFHILDATEALLELVTFTCQLQNLFLDQSCKTAVFFHLFNLAQALDGLADGAEIGQHATEPAMGYIRHAATLRFFGDSL